MASPRVSKISFTPKGMPSQQAIGEGGLGGNFHPGANFAFRCRAMRTQTDFEQVGGGLLAGLQELGENSKQHYMRPVLVEEAGLHDFSGEAGVGGHRDIHDGVVGQFGRLPRVGEVVGFAEGEAAVEHHVFFRVQRIGEDQDRRVRGGGVVFARRARRRPAVHFTGRRSAMRARMRLLPGSPQRTRLLLAISASVTSLSSRTWASPRNWRCHSAMARFSSAAAHCGDGGRERRAGGRDEDKAIEEGVVDGALQAVDFVQAGDFGGSTTVHCVPALRKCAGPGAIAAGSGAASFWPSMVTAGGARHRAGRRRTHASVKAVTLEVVTRRRNRR